MSRVASLSVTLAVALFPGLAPVLAADLTPAQLAEARTKLAAAYEQLEAEYRAIARDAFEPSAVIEKVGRDDAALLQWVRAETFWVPYQGILKGARGVLADRAGNSLDRALLLADLLEQSGYKVRLARARLDGRQALALLAGLPALPVHAFAGDCVPQDEKSLQRVKDHAAALQAALGPLPGKPQDREASRLAAASDHWWVERRAGDTWVGLDPDAPDGPLQEKPDETHDLVRREGRLVLPADLFHEVEVRVVIEAWDSGKLVERPVLKAAVRPADLEGKRVTLRHHPMSGKDALSEEKADAIRKAALAEREWLPVLVAGDRHIAKASFDDAGVVHANPNLSPAGKVGNAVGGLFGGLGGGLGAAEKPGESPSVLTAEWIEFEIRSPGSGARTVRREVFDVLGPAARAAGAAVRPAISDTLRLDRALTLAGSGAWLITPCHVSRALVRHAASKLELDQKPVYLAMLAEPDKTRRRQLGLRLEDSDPLLWAAVARRCLSPARSGVYLDSPNIIGFHLRFRAAEDGGIVARALVDMASCRVMDREGSLSAAMLQGVADAAAEDIVLEDKPGQVESTLDVLEAAGLKGSKLVALRGKGDPGLARLALPPAAAARVSADLALGYVVAIPEKPVDVRGTLRTGWWRVDPATGETSAVMDTGYHQDNTEEAFLENDTVIGRTMVRQRNPSSFWARHPGQIAREMGFNADDMNVLNLILDYQNGLLQLGLL